MSAPAARGARVLVTDGEARAALAAVRSLGRAGYEVHVASADGRSLAGASRHAASDAALGDAFAEPRAFAERLAARVAHLRPDVVLPVTEQCLGNVYRFELDADPRFACPPRALYERAVDKHALLAEAAALGVPVPRTALVEPADAPPALPEPFRYPVVLKPRRSRFWVGSGWRSGEAVTLREPAAWSEALRAPGLAGGALLQEFVPGTGAGVFLLCRDGVPLVRFAHRRLREKPPTGGAAVLSESVRPDPALLAHAEALLGALRWSGPAMVEFRRAPAGRAFLMEVNPRLWGSVQLAIDAGADFPALAVALHRGEPIPAVEPRLGVRTRWLLGDVDHLLIGLRRAEVRRETGRGAGRLVLDFLRSFADTSREEILRRDDWRPFLRELGLWVQGTWPRRAPARPAGGS